MQSVHGAGILHEYLSVACARQYQFQNFFTDSLAAVAFRRNRAAFLKGFGQVGFVLGIILPFTFLADIIAVFLMASTGDFDE